MKKWLTILGTLTAIAALVGIGAFGVFSDTETATENTFTAGTLDLQVGGEDDPNVVHVDLSNMKPCDGVGGAEHSTIQYQWTLSNVGTIAGQPWIEIANLVEKDNGCNDPEGDVDSTCGDPGVGEGELGQYLFAQINAAGASGYMYPNDASCIDGRKCPVSYWASYGPVGQAGDQAWETIQGGASTPNGIGT
jgi:predicted ribosomally synthesized peptide with SipW-like signal peptide